MKEMKCFICTQIVYSEIGNGCRMCGMNLRHEDEDFCCKPCEDKYGEINKNDL